mmetsp:Transcript_7730/g.21533  ORF Transcript_7730/g.21533 Transcript_7730/m.21533 type:complete len:293 (-) Transcript_7730:315-1193(-)
MDVETMILCFDGLWNFLLHRDTVEGHSHGMKAVVNIQSDSCDGASHGTSQEQTGITNIIIVEILSQWSICIGVVNGILNESFLTSFFANGRSGTRFQRPSGNSVDADSPLAPSFVSKRSCVAFQLGLCRRHATTVSRDNFLGSNVGQRNHTSTFVHQRSKILEKRNSRVGRCRRGGQVSFAGCLKQGLGHLGAVGKRVDQDVNLSVVGGNSFSDFGNRVSVKSSVTLIGLDFIRNIVGCIKDSIKRVNLFNDHGRSVGKFRVFLELSFSQAHLENLQNRRPSSHNDSGPGIS